MDPEEFLIEGTQISYREWTHGYIYNRLMELWRVHDYHEKWEIELAFMNESRERFTAGYRLITDAFADKLFFEITWVRANAEAVLISYVSRDEEQNSIDAHGRITKPHVLVGRNTNHHRY